MSDHTPEALHNRLDRLAQRVQGLTAEARELADDLRLTMADRDRLLADRDRLRAINADLLAALQALLNMYVPKDDWDTNIAKQARAAIAKATGAS
jgi:hypothetical protein